jgi:TRAP transporter 4TM/12TM fusion protein
MDSEPAPASPALRPWRRQAVNALGVALCVFVLFEVNYPRLTPQSQLSLFALFGLVLCFLTRPLSRRLRASSRWHLLDALLAALATFVCLYVALQSEPMFSRFWFADSSLGDRAGAEVPLDHVVGVLGVLLVLEATRRIVGVALPLLSGAFLVYAALGSYAPDWLFPHRGYSIERIVSQTFLHSQGVFGTALSVMFTYVFLFVLFGVILEATGATEYIIDATRRLFRNSSGGPAKVAVLSSGLMGSLSGSAVANTATTGTFTIPLMRSAGFRPWVAAGVEAAASSGGALVPPVMGAGAYMMLEIIEPPVTYLQIIQAAILPAVVYYLSLFFIVHFTARRIGAADRDAAAAIPRTGRGRFEGLLFFVSLAALVAFILSGYTVFRSVTLAIGVVLVLGAIHPRTRLAPAAVLTSMVRAARSGVALICAAACVGIIIGVVTLTGVGTKLPATILPLAQENLLLALVLIMVSSIVLGMGLPSAVCYLLMATLVGPALGKLGVVPLAAHMFIFYFGMMSMVTPPVALAAYTAATIANTSIMRSGLAAFRFALVGFTLPYMFVFRPELLLLSADGGAAAPLRVVGSLAVAVLGVVALAAGLAGYLQRELGWVARSILFAGAALLLFPRQGELLPSVNVSILDLAGGALFLGVLAVGWIDSRSGASRR